MTRPPVGYMSSGFLQGKAREAAKRGTANAAGRSARIARANELQRLKPTQEHPRQCRCDRPLFDQDDECVKCGLPEVWRPATLAERAAIAELVNREREAAYRRRQRGVAS